MTLLSASVAESGENRHNRIGKENKRPQQENYREKNYHAEKFHCNKERIRGGETGEGAPWDQDEGENNKRAKGSGIGEGECDEREVGLGDECWEVKRVNSVNGGDGEWRRFEILD